MPAEAEVSVSATGVLHGEVITRQWVVDMILDLAGYTSNRDLTSLRLVEPAAGTGAFLARILARLLASAKNHGVKVNLATVGDAIRVFDIQPAHAVALEALVVSQLVSEGIAQVEAVALADRWVCHDDYLVPGSTNRLSDIDLVVGNPPYIRMEDVPAGRAAKYRSLYPTMTGRADIYVAFFEASLRCLHQEGKVAFICADRWMRNDYGKELRQLITTEGYAMDSVVTLHEADAFETQVNAYPAITIIRRGEQGRACIADTTAAFGERQSRDLVSAISRRQHDEARTYSVGVLDEWHSVGKVGWPHGSPAFLQRLASMDALPTVEQTGARIGIGVATGADSVYLTHPNRFPPDVEDDRLLKLSHADDIRSGEWAWTGRYLVNPWTADGLVSLSDYPRLAQYLAGAQGVRDRNVAKRNPNKWWRTIDRVAYRLLDRRLILMQDMSQHVTPVVSPAGFYPHHNLYWIDVQDSSWDPEVLAGILLADQIREQVAARCVLMRGRTLRLQAQYLRQVRIPSPDNVTIEAAKEFNVAYLNRDRVRATETLAPLLP